MPYLGCTRLSAHGSGRLGKKAPLFQALRFSLGGSLGGRQRWLPGGYQVRMVGQCQRWIQRASSDDEWRRVGEVTMCTSGDGGKR